MGSRCHSVPPGQSPAIEGSTYPVPASSSVAMSGKKATAREACQRCPQCYRAPPRGGSRAGTDLERGSSESPRCEGDRDKDPAPRADGMTSTPRDRKAAFVSSAENSGDLSFRFLPGRHCDGFHHVSPPATSTPSPSRPLPRRPGPHLMDGKCLMTTSRAWIVSKGTLGSRPESASCNACKLTQDTHLMDTLKMRSFPSPGSVTSSSTWGPRAHGDTGVPPEEVPGGQGRGSASGTPRRGTVSQSFTQPHAWGRARPVSPPRPSAVPEGGRGIWRFV